MCTRCRRPGGDQEYLRQWCRDAHEARDWSLDMSWTPCDRVRTDWPIWPKIIRTLSSLQLSHMNVEALRELG